MSCTPKYRRFTRGRWQRVYVWCRRQSIGPSIAKLNHLSTGWYARIGGRCRTVGRSTRNVVGVLRVVSCGDCHGRFVMSQSVLCIQAANAICGEGPSWGLARGVLYWVDIRRPALFRWDRRLGQTGHWPMPRPVGCVSATQSERLVFAESDGVEFLELGSGEISRVAAPENNLPGNRFDDGKIDRAGRFWAPTLDDECVQATGSLYRLDTDLSLHQLFRFH